MTYYDIVLRPPDGVDARRVWMCTQVFLEIRQRKKKVDI